MNHALEPTDVDMLEMGRLVLDHVVDIVAKIDARPVDNVANGNVLGPLVDEFLAPPPETPGDVRQLLDRLDRASLNAWEASGAGNFAYIPSGGLFTSALAEFYARALNRFGGVAFVAPGLIAAEESVVRWLAHDVCGLPAGSGGLLMTGGSMANFSAVVTARETRLGENIEQGTIYVTRHTHRSVAKAARMAGIRRDNVREVPSTASLAMDMDAARAMIESDKRAGLRPFLIVGSAGTTDTGAIDPLTHMAKVAADHDLWCHVDGAYGGLFRLTERGRDRLSGMALADSVTLDPHKSLFLPFGTGALLVRDPRLLFAAHNETGAYQQDYVSTGGLPDYALLGPELSREVRGLRVWLPLHVHGVAAFRAQLDEKLDLAELVYEKLRLVPSLEVPWRPMLSTVVFRVRALASGDADEATRRLLDCILADGRFSLSSTELDGRQAIRICILANRTHAGHVVELMDLITSAVPE
ncbi:aminotransferase class I/II-fold pyridoxal phosphate-dependent enzyme [Pseudonocardia yunnanensis]|uniref:Pyridoxal phosphate-dependent decarboxylase family protein n=1 Tax=Pseudonocardia yunnanensis TaxID=58107 RepID=A0ABW4EWN6_9PSEU